jgi:uncharacterized membrane protein YpjA
MEREEEVGLKNKKTNGGCYGYSLYTLQKIRLTLRIKGGVRDSTTTLNFFLESLVITKPNA